MRVGRRQCFAENEIIYALDSLSRRGVMGVGKILSLLLLYHYHHLVNSVFLIVRFKKKCMGPLPIKDVIYMHGSACVCYLQLFHWPIRDSLLSPNLECLYLWLHYLQRRSSTGALREAFRERGKSIILPWKARPFTAQRINCDYERKKEEEDGANRFTSVCCFKILNLYIFTWCNYEFSIGISVWDTYECRYFTRGTCGQGRKGRQCLPWAFLRIEFNELTIYVLLFMLSLYYFNGFRI